MRAIDLDTFSTVDERAPVLLVGSHLLIQNEKGHPLTACPRSGLDERLMEISVVARTLF